MEGGRLRRLAVTHVDPEKVALVQELDRRYPEKPDLEFGVYHTFRSGKPEMVPEVTDDILRAAAQDDEHLRILRELGLTSYLCVPLLANGRSVGVITLISADPARRYGERDLAFAQELAARSALAIENARLYRESRESAEWLSTTLRSIGDAVVVTDEKGAVKFPESGGRGAHRLDAGGRTGRPLAEVFRIVSEAPANRSRARWTRRSPPAEVVGLANHTELIAKDGRRIAIDDSAAPIFDLQGKISGVVLVFRDVTTQRQAERDRAERARLAAFSAAVHQALSQAESMPTRCCGIARSWWWSISTPRLRASGRSNAAENVLELRASSGLYTHLDGAARPRAGRLIQDRHDRAGAPAAPDEQRHRRSARAAAGVGEASRGSSPSPATRCWSTTGSSA